MTYIDLTTVENRTVKIQPNDITITIDHNPIRCDCRLYDILPHYEGRFLIHESKCQSPTFKCKLNERDFRDCPDKCTCYMRPEDNAFIVDCGYKGLFEAPQTLVSSRSYWINEIELNLTGNYLTRVPDLNKDGYNKVATLMLDHNEISNVIANGLSNKLAVRTIKPLQVMENRIFIFSMAEVYGTKKCCRIKS